MLLENKIISGVSNFSNAHVNGIINLLIKPKFASNPKQKVTLRDIFDLTQDIAEYEVKRPNSVLSLYPKGIYEVVHSTIMRYTGASKSRMDSVLMRGGPARFLDEDAVPAKSLMLSMLSSIDYHSSLASTSAPSRYLISPIYFLEPMIGITYYYYLFSLVDACVNELRSNTIFDHEIALKISNLDSLSFKERRKAGISIDMVKSQEASVLVIFRAFFRSIISSFFCQFDSPISDEVTAAKHYLINVILGCNPNPVKVDHLVSLTDFGPSTLNGRDIDLILLKRLMADDIFNIVGLN